MLRPVNIRHRIKAAAAQQALHRAGPILNRSVIVLDYAPNQQNVPRYTQPHARLDALIAAHKERYGKTLATIKQYSEDLAAIPIRSEDPLQPAWINRFLAGLDGAAIYALLRSSEPPRYFEVGSGNSTLFAARAKADGKLSTRITSIDPYPRAEINAICDQIIREPLESQDLAIWGDVQAGDMVFIDGSHRVFMNGDVVAFFLDILPSLPAGVLVGIHDIYLPYDYPADIADRYYSEQYMLAAWLLGGTGAEIVLPAHWAFTRMRNEVDELWATNPEFASLEHHGCAFWFRTP